MRMCGIAQRGAWDPDGCGIRRIEDAGLKAKLQAKYREMLTSTTAIALSSFALYFFIF
jgi:hypothetical protein